MDEDARASLRETALEWFRAWQRESEDLTIYKRAMDSMAAQMVHPKMTGLEMAKMQLGEK